MDRLDSLKVDTQGQVHAFGLVPELWNVLVELAKAGVKIAKTTTEAVDWAVSEFKKRYPGTMFDEASARGALADSLGQEAGAAAQEKADRPRLRQGFGGQAGAEALKVRQMSEQLDASPDIPPAVKELVKNRMYEPRTNAEDAGLATRIIQGMGGPERAVSVFEDLTNGLPSSVRMILGFGIVKQLGAMGKHAAAAAFYDDHLAGKSTDLAQGLQAHAVFMALTPEGKVLWARRKIARAGEELVSRVRTELAAARESLGRLNRAGAEAAANSPEVQAAARKVVDRALEEQALKPGSELRVALVGAALEWMQNAGLVSPELGALLAKHFAAPLKTLREVLEAAGVTDAAKVAKRLEGAFAGEMARQLKSVARTAASIRERNQLWGRYKRRAVEALARAIESKGETGPRRAALDLFTGRLVSNMRAAMTEGRGTKGKGQGALTDVQVLAEAIGNREKYREVWEATLDRWRAEAAASGNEAGLMSVEGLAGLPAPVAPTGLVDRVVRQQMTKVRMDLGRVVREHYTRQETAGRTLADGLTQEAGLSGENAAYLAGAVDRRFRALVSERKAAELEKILRPVRRMQLAKPGLAERLIELSNLGALGPEAYWRALQEKLDLPQWTPELARRVHELGQRIQELPEDRVEARDKASIEMLNEIERAKGTTLGEVGLGLYITNILTGITTHAKNVLSTTLNAVGALGTEALRAVASGRLDDLPLMLEAAGVGIGKGGRAAADILRTGMVTGTRIYKVEPGRVMEITRFGEKGGVPARGRLSRAVLESRVAKVLNAWKYNYRAMGAEDMLLFKPLEEVKAAMLVKRQVRSEGLRGAEAQERARQILGYGAEQVQAARDQAVREGLSGSAAKRRAAEVLSGGRSQEVRETAAEFARRQTFNNRPYGLLGEVAGMFNRAKGSQNQKLRTAATLIVPFTNIVANVVNDSLNYTPVGALRAWRAKTNLLGQEMGNLSEVQRSDLRAELYAKATIGTVGLMGLAFWAGGDLDDKDPDRAIYGAGPQDASDRKGWLANGGIAHSVKVGNRYYSYANTPMAIPLAMVGNYMDRIRDARVYKVRSATRVEEDAALATAAAMLGSARVITEQSFLVGLMDLFDLVGNSQAEVGARKAVKTGVRMASSFVVPNLVRQVDKAFDPTVYDARSLEDQVLQAVPFARSQGRPALNALGQVVVNPLEAQFTSKERGDALVKLLAERGLWPALPSRNEVYARKGRTMTDDEYYQFVKESGTLMGALLGRMQGSLGRYDDETARRVVATVAEKSRQAARARMGF
jgi:hypothetical protein